MYAARWRAVPRELLFVLAGIGVYFGVRGITASDADTAQQNAVDLVQLERDVGLYVEAELQGMIDGSGAVMTFMNWVYIWGHWPVITAVLLWLFLRHPAGYREIRNTMLLSGGIGLVIFVVYPVAPPRLAGLGLVDTVTEYSTAYRVLQPPAFVNQYAAMPSLHVGWDLLMGIALVTWSTHLAVRALGVALPALMTASVVLTANHYLVDAVAGVALVLACLWVVRSEVLTRVAGPVLGRAARPVHAYLRRQPGAGDAGRADRPGGSPGLVAGPTLPQQRDGGPADRPATSEPRDGCLR
jgi:hypothetical protein